MKGFLKWFGSKAKMKRWMLVILIGMILTCYGISKITIFNELTILQVFKIVISFVVGFTMIVLGLVFSQKRVLELLIEDTDDRMKKGKENINTKSLIFNKKVYEEGPNVVVIGGGAGLNYVIKGMKKYTNNITAIVTVSDYGKVASFSRKELDLKPIENVKQGIISLANKEETMRNLMEYKFEFGKLKDLSFGDIYISAMQGISKDFSEAIVKTANVLNITGKILPVTLEEVKICAELEDGTIIEEKDKIPEIVTDKVTKINRMFITPNNCRPAPGVLEAIEKADAIIIGPGSLYTNVIPNLLVKNVSTTIKNSKAIKIYVSNIMTDPGQTDDYSLADHLDAIMEHAGKEIIDYCIYDTGEVVPEYIKKYNKQGADLVEQDISKAKTKGIRLLQKDLSIVENDTIRHNPDAIAEAIIEIICDDLKFQDKQNEPGYLRLISKLKQRKENVKVEKKQEKKKNKIINKSQENKKTKEQGKKKSKFNKKYKERIESIQHSEEKRLENLKELEAKEQEEKEKFLKEIKEESKKKNS